MKALRIGFGLLAFAGLAAAGVAVAANLTSSRHGDYYSPGRHQFYVWCAGNGGHAVVQNGLSADDAQDKLYAAEKAAGHSACWPVWQGRISS